MGKYFRHKILFSGGILVCIILNALLYMFTGFISNSYCANVILWTTFGISVALIVFLVFYSINFRIAFRLVIAFFLILLWAIMSDLFVHYSISWKNSLQETCKGVLSSEHYATRLDAINSIGGWRFNYWSLPCECKYLESEIDKYNRDGACPIYLTHDVKCKCGDMHWPTNNDCSGRQVCIENNPDSARKIVCLERETDLINLVCGPNGSLSQPKSKTE